VSWSSSKTHQETVQGPLIKPARYMLVSHFVNKICSEKKLLPIKDKQKHVYHYSSVDQKVELFELVIFCV